MSWTRSILEPMPEGPRDPVRTGASLFHRLEPLLDQVSKPIQYVGGELNSTVKDWNCGGFGPDGQELTARWALMYPDAYEVALPNQGVMILYEVINERPDALAAVSYTHLRAHETVLDLVCRLL